MFCKNVARLAVAKGCHTWIRSLATAKRATFLQNILWESCSKFYFKQCSLKKSLKILIFQREYMEMCFHGNQLSWGIKHPLISLRSKYCSPARLRLKNFPRSVSSSIFCMDLLSAFNNARFKFQGSGSNTLEVMSICLNHIKLKKFQENF